MTEQERQEIIQELKDYIDSILKPIDNEKVFPLKDLMEDYQISVARLSSEIGVHKETIWKWMNNQIIISDDYAEKLHKFFEYQLELDH